MVDVTYNLDLVCSETSFLVLKRTKVSNTNVRTSSKCLLTSTPQLGNISEAVLGHNLRTLRPLAPVVARGVGVLEDAL